MDRVTDYARKVMQENKECKAVIQACQRHLRDLENTELEWRPEEAEKYLRFAELLHYHNDKTNKPEPLRLKGFQIFIIGSIFGWYRRGARRFSDAYIQIARKNGKSFLSAFFTIAYSFICPIQDGEIYCAGTELENASFSWNEARKFIEREKGLRKRYKIQEYRHTIQNKKNHTIIKAISGNTEADGKKGILNIIDEYHLHPDDSMYSVLRDGQIGLANALSIVITTAGFNLNRDCYRQYKHAKNIVSGAITQDNLFVYIAEADLPDAHEQPEAYEKELWNPEQWRKANPLILDTEDEVQWQKIKDKAEEARTLGGTRLRDFIVKHLDCWRVVGGSPYIPADAWERCGTDKKIQNMQGRECIIGLDLSSKNDLASVTILFPPTTQEKKIYIYSHSYLPKNALDRHIRSDKAPYDIWAQQGLLTLTDCGGNNGYILDYKFIIEDIKAIIKNYALHPRMICYDPMGASGIIADLEEICPELIEIGQYPKSMNDATRHAQGTILGGGIEYDRSNELLTWSMINAQAVLDSKKQMIIDKKENTNRIDAIDAMLDAYKGWLTIKPEEDHSAETWFTLMKDL